jgi:hypothetical protein
MQLDELHYEKSQCYVTVIFRCLDRRFSTLVCIALNCTPLHQQFYLIGTEVYV